MQEDANAAFLREQAKKCRRLADSIVDRQTIVALLEMAAVYEREANSIDGADRVPDPNTMPGPQPDE